MCGCDSGEEELDLVRENSPMVLNVRREDVVNQERKYLFTKLNLRRQMPVIIHMYHPPSPHHDIPKYIYTPRNGTTPQIWILGRIRGSPVYNMDATVRSTRCLP